MVIIGDNWTYVRNIFETIKDLINNELAYQQYRVRRDIGHQMSFINNNFSALLHSEKTADVATENHIIAQSPQNLMGVRDGIFVGNSQNDDSEHIASRRGWLGLSLLVYKT